MKTIYRNEEILALIQGTYIIHDASVTKFDIYTLEHKLYVDVYFASITTEKVIQTNFKLSFIDVLEYSLYWNENHHFYYVERFKFFKIDKGFYISLDPADESDKLSDKDQDIILSKEIQGAFV